MPVMTVMPFLRCGSLDPGRHGRHSRLLPYLPFSLAHAMLSYAQLCSASLLIQRRLSQRAVESQKLLSRDATGHGDVMGMQKDMEVLNKFAIDR